MNIVLILEIALGTLLGWLLIQWMQWIGIGRAKVNIESTVEGVLRKVNIESAVEGVFRKLEKERLDRELQDMASELTDLKRKEYRAMLYIQQEWPKKNLFPDLKPEHDVKVSEIDHFVAGRSSYFYRVKIEELHKSIERWEKQASRYLDEWSKSPEGQKASAEITEWEKRMGGKPRE